MPLLFRLYTPEEFAPWAVALAIATLIGGIATLRFELAIVVERDHADASALFWLAVMLASIVGLLASAVLATPAVQGWVFPDVVAQHTGILVGAWVILSALIQALQGWALHRAAFMEISVAQISNAMVLNAVQISGGYLAGGTGWLIMGSVLGQLTMLTVLMRGVVRSASAPASIMVCPGRIKGLLSRHRRFPVFSLPYTLCTIARERLAVVLLSVWVGPAEVGFYSQAWRVMNFPVGLTSSAIRPVVFHAAAEQGLAAQEARIGRILAALVLLGAPWLGVVLYRPEELFGLVLGDAWSRAGTYAAVFAVPVFLFALRNWMDRILDVAGRQDLNLITEFVSAISSLAGLVLALLAGKPILVAVGIQSAILAVNYGLFMLIAYRVAGYRVAPLGHMTILCVLLVSIFMLLLHVVGSWLSPRYVFFVVGTIALLFNGMAVWPLLRRLR